MWHEILGVYLCGLAIFLVLPEPIFAIKGDWFFFLSESPRQIIDKIIDNISFLSRTCKGNVTYFLYYRVCTPCKTGETDCFSLSFILIILFLNKIQVVI